MKRYYVTVPIVSNCFSTTRLLSFLAIGNAFVNEVVTVGGM